MQAGIQRCPAGPSRAQTTPRSATPRRVGAGFKPAHSIHARSSLQFVIPSEAESLPRVPRGGSKTVAPRQPSNPQHNPRPNPRHTGAGRYPEVAGWTQSRPTTPRCATPRRAGALREPPTAAAHVYHAQSSLQLVIPSEAEGSKTIALREPSKPPPNPRTLSNSPLPPSILESSTHANRHSRAGGNPGAAAPAANDTAPNRPPPTHDTPPRRGGFQTRPLHPRSVNPRAPIVIPSEAEGSKTIALRQPPNPPHNPRPNPRHTGAGRYPEASTWTWSRAPNS